jgi:hypothetical protein
VTKTKTQYSCTVKVNRDRGVRGGGAAGSSLENVHAMVPGVSHHDAPIAVDGNAALRRVVLSVA